MRMRMTIVMMRGMMMSGLMDDDENNKNDRY